MNSLQKLQNLSKQAASVLEQMTAGASPRSEGQRRPFYRASLFYLWRLLCPRKLHALKNVEKLASGKTRIRTKSSNKQSYVISAFSNRQKSPLKQNLWQSNKSVKEEISNVIEFLKYGALKIKLAVSNSMKLKSNHLMYLFLKKSIDDCTLASLDVKL